MAPWLIPRFGRCRRGIHARHRTASSDRAPVRGRSNAASSRAPRRRVERPAVLPVGRRLGVDPLDGPVRGRDDLREVRSRAPVREGRHPRRALDERLELGHLAARLLVRFDPRRRHAGLRSIDAPSPSRPPPSRPRAAAAGPGTAGRRRRPAPSPRGSAARRGSPTNGPICGRPSASRRCGLMPRS